MNDNAMEITGAPGRIVSAEELAKRAAAATARAVQKAQIEAVTTARKCLSCQEEFLSEGAHNRLCNRCRSRRG